MTNSTDFVTNYFTEEKIESLFFIIIAIVSITLALFFLFIIKYSFFNGLAYPLLIVGIIQLAVGTTVYLRSPKDIARVEHMIQFEPQKIQAQELPNMERVISNFTLYKWIEIGLIILGITLFLYFYKSSQTFWKGLGLGLLMQASIMLTLDIIAEHRANLYKQTLLHITV